MKTYNEKKGKKIYKIVAIWLCLILLVSGMACGKKTVSEQEVETAEVVKETEETCEETLTEKSYEELYMEMCEAGDCITFEYSEEFLKLSEEERNDKISEFDELLEPKFTWDVVGENDLYYTYYDEVLEDYRKRTELFMEIYGINLIQDIIEKYQYYDFLDFHDYIIDPNNGQQIIISAYNGCIEIDYAPLGLHIFHVYTPKTINGACFEFEYNHNEHSLDSKDGKISVQIGTNEIACCGWYGRYYYKKGLETILCEVYQEDDLINAFDKTIEYMKYKVQEEENKEYLYAEEQIGVSEENNEDYVIKFSEDFLKLNQEEQLVKLLKYQKYLVVNLWEDLYGMDDNQYSEYEKKKMDLFLEIYGEECINDLIERYPQLDFLYIQDFIYENDDNGVPGKNDVKIESYGHSVLIVCPAIGLQIHSFYTPQNIENALLNYKYDYEDGELYSTDDREDFKNVDEHKTVRCTIGFYEKNIYPYWYIYHAYAEFRDSSVENEEYRAAFNKTDEYIEYMKKKEEKGE